MKRVNNDVELSATDLVGYLNCRRLTELDLSVALGRLKRPTGWNPSLDVLRERGARHEAAFIAYLETQGHSITRIEGSEISASAVSDTQRAMRRGDAIIVQAALKDRQWGGRADILRRVKGKSNFGSWSYEAIDTKLARETKAGSVLQLCVYSDLLSAVQGCEPEMMHIVVPWTEYELQSYRLADYGAYYRRVRQGLVDAVAIRPTSTYPEPCAHCDVCAWASSCDKQRRDDDHPSLVAGITRVQIGELRARGIATTSALAAIPLPLPWKPERGSVQSLVRVREQARIQVTARQSGNPTFETLPIERGFGLCRLPEPSPGDVFLDFEGDPFVGAHGLEYLLGYVLQEDGQDVYRHHWSLSAEEEKSTFESFVDFVLERWQRFPDLHIYHYAPYEPAALKRLMGRYATREDAIDRMLRAGLYVDLYQIVRHAVRASVESYSIKRLEPFYGFTRATSLETANPALARFQADLELGDPAAIAPELKEVVVGYNEDDCRSTLALRNWLEEQRSRLIAQGAEISRPDPGNGDPGETVSQWLAKIEPLLLRLLSGIPADHSERTAEQQGHWILAHLLDWHRREKKASWWEFFRLRDLSAEDLLDERAGLSGLQFREVLPPASPRARAPVHRYSFPPQETDVRGDEQLRAAGGQHFGSVVAIDVAAGFVDVKKHKDAVDLHPVAAFIHKDIPTDALAQSLVRIAEHVIEHGLQGDGPYRAARDLLLRSPPHVRGEPLQREDEPALDTALRLCRVLEGGILPIQGPPGAGKTYVAANMIVALVGLGKTVGVTANSHKVIRHLVDAAIARAKEVGQPLHCCLRPDEVEPAQPHVRFVRDNADVFTALAEASNVGGGTAWLWASPDATNTVDVLFVDEAAQMSLANVLAASPSAQAIVLVGDPQQLDQPLQGTHPEGTEVSALAHVLGDRRTIAPEQGLFLAETWRLHPDICTFTSELFYEGKLHSRPELANNRLHDCGLLPAHGLAYLPVNHANNQNVATEEAAAIQALVARILSGTPQWTDRFGKKRPLTCDDIIVITPYNAQVFELRRLVPGVRAGTVDKFQGQEAPIAIYSTASSTHADAPRGMEFLYSLNRFNVATSRAKCVSVLVSSPRLFEADCRTPRQIQLANAFCRYIELAHPIAL